MDTQTGVIYRNYNIKNLDFEEILKLRNFLKKNKIKFYLSNNLKLALKLKLDGAYVPSFNKNFSHLSYTYNNKFMILGSAHNLKEIRIKESQKVDLLFISSIFKSNQNYLGVNKFKILSNYSDKKIIALGGISKNNLIKLRLTRAFGFAGISYFR